MWVDDLQQQISEWTAMSLLRADEPHGQDEYLFSLEWLTPAQMISRTDLQPMCWAM